VSLRSQLKRAKRRAMERATSRAAATLRTYRSPVLPPPPPHPDLDIEAVARELRRDHDVLVVTKPSAPGPTARATAAFLLPKAWRRGDLCPACSANALAWQPNGRFGSLMCAGCGAVEPETERPTATPAYCRICRKFHADPGCVPNTPKRYRHGEAFCRMKYASKDGRIVEWIWNSRDGVTPFTVPPRDFAGPGTFDDMLSHVEWHLDQVRPDYKPQPGERIFVDLTPEVARARVVARVEREWDAGEYPMRESFDSKEEAVGALLQDDCRDGAPDIVTVGEEVPRG
jgi:hypothetical protein